MSSAFVMDDMDDMLIAPSGATDEEEDDTPATSRGQELKGQSFDGDYVDAFWCFLPRKVVHIILIVMLVLAQVNNGMVVPIYVNACISAGSDAFLSLWLTSAYFPIIFLVVNIIIIHYFDKGASLWPTASWIYVFVVGGLTGLGSLLQVYASDPARVPPYLHAILGNANLPLLVLFRYLILHKGVSWHQGACLGGVMVGLVVAMVPQVSSISSSSHHSLAYRILWPLCYMAAAWAGIFNSIFIEKTMKDEKQVNSFSFMHWIQWTQLLTIFLLFWTDFVPGFGQASSWDEFISYQWNGTRCHYSSEADCHGLSYLSWMLTAGYCVTIFATFLLMRYAEGAIYIHIIGSVVFPVVTILWTLFTFEPDFTWSPHFDEGPAFALGSLVLTLPSVVTYNWLSEKYRLQGIMKEQEIGQTTTPTTSQNLGDCDQDNIITPDQGTSHEQDDTKSMTKTLSEPPRNNLSIIGGATADLYDQPSSHVTKHHDISPVPIQTLNMHCTDSSV